MAFSEDTHVTYTNDAGEDVIGVVKSFSAGKYEIKVRSGDTHSVPEKQVSELKVNDPAPCPVAGNN